MKTIDEIKNKIFCGDTLETIKTFPDKSINMVCTSPPYYALRNYQWDGQWGLEENYTDYLKHLWQLMDEIYRVLRDDGTVFINLGDTYSNSGGQGNQHKQAKAFGNFSPHREKSMPAKCLMLIPHRFAIGCVERNWIVRNSIVWGKRNGMPSPVIDRFANKHEYFFFMVKSQKYYFDLDGIRDKYSEVSIKRFEAFNKNKEFFDETKHKFDPLRKSQSPMAILSRGAKAYTKIESDNAELFSSPRARQHREGYDNNPDAINPQGKNPGDVSDFWDVPTQPSSEKHYATFNTKLIDKPIVAGCPEGGIILDPFAGTSTTLARAKELKRNYIGIEGKAEYVEISEKRLKTISDVLI